MKTASELKHQVEYHMRNYGVRSTTIENSHGELVEVWELYRRKPVKYGLQKSAYFCKTTFRQVFGA